MALLDRVPQASVAGMSLATSGLIAALLDALATEGTLSKTAVVGVLTTAKAEIGKFQSHIAYHDAVFFLDGVLAHYERP
jgi:hypothetical protein